MLDPVQPHLTARSLQQDLDHAERTGNPNVNNRRHREDRCCVCGSRHGLETDHDVPTAAGGLPWAINFRTRCQRHHRRKTALKDPVHREMAKRYGPEWYLELQPATSNQWRDGGLISWALTRWGDPPAVYPTDRAEAIEYVAARKSLIQAKHAAFLMGVCKILWGDYRGKSSMNQGLVHRTHKMVTRKQLRDTRSRAYRWWLAETRNVRAQFQKTVANPTGSLARFRQDAESAASLFSTLWGLNMEAGRQSHELADELSGLFCKRLYSPADLKDGMSKPVKSCDVIKLHEAELRLFEEEARDPECLPELAKAHAEALPTMRALIVKLRALEGIAK